MLHHPQGFGPGNAGSTAARTDVQIKAGESTYTELGVEKTHKLKQGVTLVGRLPTSDLVLADPSVSTHHASLRVQETECRLQDANSRFGTFLNGEIMRGEVVVPPGATIKLGEIELMLEQYVPEQELLSEHHQVSEEPGTIFKSMPVAPAPRGGDGHLIRLLAEAQRALLSTKSLNDVLTKVVDLPASAIPIQDFTLAPEQSPQDDRIDKAGQALIAMLHKAADASNEEYERATILAGRPASQLRTTENRIKEFEAEASHFRDRAARAEEWLKLISREIESKLIAPQGAAQLPNLHVAEPDADRR